MIMSELKVDWTTVVVDGCEEDCVEVSNGYTMVRIQRMYHYIGNDTTLFTEYLDGEYNNNEEWSMDFDDIRDDLTAIEIAKEFSVYL